MGGRRTLSKFASAKRRRPEDPVSAAQRGAARRSRGTRPVRGTAEGHALFLNPGEREAGESTGRLTKMKVTEKVGALLRSVKPAVRRDYASVRGWRDLDPRGFSHNGESATCVRIYTVSRGETVAPVNTVDCGRRISHRSWATAVTAAWCYQQYR